MVLAARSHRISRPASTVPDTAGLDPLRADVDCVPGIPMRLKLIDKETGKAPKGVEVSYCPISPNPHVREVPGYAPVRGSGPYNEGILQDDGTYLLGVLPGPGAVTVRAAEGKYRPACVDPKAFFNARGPRRPIRVWLYGDRRHPVRRGRRGRRRHVAIAVQRHRPGQSRRRTRVPSPPRPCSSATRRREVRVLGPEGEPLAGVAAEGEGVEATKTPGVMTVSGLNPMRPKRFYFRHAGRKLVGFLLARGDEAEPYTVRLAAVGHDRRPAGRRGGPAAAQGPPDDRRLGELP